MPGGQTIVQTVDFFTPVVDDPYSFGQIAAANALSDVYAMGGRPISVMNIACFDPSSAPSEVWSQILLGMYDKTVEAGAIVVGGHSVEDDEPKFGMSVTGIVDRDQIFTNSSAQVGDEIWLTKPLGSGIVTTAAKNDKCSEEELEFAISVMRELNKKACEAAHLKHVKCATDITGFGLAGHLWNVAEASGVRLEIDASTLPLLPGVERMIGEGCVTGGGSRNRDYLGERLVLSGLLADWVKHLVVDPQTSGGLALFGKEIGFGVKIGQVVEGEPGILVS